MGPAHFRGLHPAGLLARLAARGAVSPPLGVSTGPAQVEATRVEAEEPESDLEPSGPSPAQAFAAEFSKELAHAFLAAEAIFAEGPTRVVPLPPGA